MNYYTDEETGRLFVNDTPVFAKMMGGTLHCMIRATDEATFNSVGLSVNLLEEINILDDEGNPTGETKIVTTSGNTVTRLGPHVLVPGTYDEEGNELTPPVLDNRYHVNFWLGPETVARGNWVQWILDWMTNGATGSPNRSEESLAHMGIELLDPLTITSPSNVLL